MQLKSIRLTKKKQFIPDMWCMMKQSVALTGRNTTGPPWSYNETGGGMTSSPGLRE